jgi:GNAT superfamily N-acetyltransferase
VTDISIRPYRVDDLETCRGLWRELTQRHRDIYEDQTIGGDDPGLEVDEHLRHPHLAGVWLAERDATVLGLAGLLVEGDGGEVEPIVVTAAARSQGIGRMLLAHAIEEARGRGVRFLSIRPVARNIEAIELFHETGFRTLGHLDMFMDLANTPPRNWRPGITVHGREFSF